MLQLKKITKNYGIGENKLTVLKDVDLTFRKNEFVSILGPSGCGKTTMLNIIGGLDQYSSGDLLIEGKSTKSYKDSDWDAFRNTTIGFVFQNYNLIGHLSLLDNIEMALSLSGISKQVKREKSLEVLKRVGLEGHSHKKPNQLSGGQMQRVSIARALVTDPKVLLADEPTGALDSKTSKKVMNLIQEISKDRLVVMVTHNAKIANQYSDRIIRLLDGEVIEDSNPVENQITTTTEKLEQTKKPSMSLKAALKSSFNNLFTKKGRTIITTIAGSIGIIGIAAVLALSNGITKQIADLQSDQFSDMPVTVERDYYDLSALFGFNSNDDEVVNDDGAVYVESYSGSSTHLNIFNENFITHLNTLDSDTYTKVEYVYNTPIRVLQKTNQGIVKEADGLSAQNKTLEDLQTNYELLEGALPTNNNEIMLVIGSNNQINPYVLESLGIDGSGSISYDKIIGKTFKVITNNAFYNQDGDVFVEVGDFNAKYDNAESIELTITGIIKGKDKVSDDVELLSNGLYYQNGLYDDVYQNSIVSDVVTFQKAHTAVNVLTGFAFDDTYTLEMNLFDLGGSTVPGSISFYPKDIDSQAVIVKHIEDFNIGKAEEDQILYSNPIEDITKEISKIINIITMVLSGIAGVSLVVSSLMIGIITYVSVIERTKEIGIMRSLGARKKDIARIFNAETFIIGFGSGLLGVIIVVLISLPINAVLNSKFEIEGLIRLPILGAIGLIALSTCLTLLSGLIPSRIAANKDPVEALRTE